MAVVVGDHGRKEGLVGLDGVREETRRMRTNEKQSGRSPLDLRAVRSAGPHPEMRHGVDLQRLLNQRVWSVHELLSRHNPGVVHQNADVARLSLHLRGEETVTRESNRWCGINKPKPRIVLCGSNGVKQQS